MEMMFVAYYTDRWADNYSKKIFKGVVLKVLRYIRMFNSFGTSKFINKSFGPGWRILVDSDF